MRFLTRLFITLVFLLVFAAPLRAQNPNVAVHVNVDKGKRECVEVLLQNLRAMPVKILVVELWVYDTGLCRRVCVARKIINQTLAACKTTTLEICCPARISDARRHTYYVRVRHSAGTNEGWAWFGEIIARADQASGVGSQTAN